MYQSAPPKRIDVILVHGTWASGAPWSNTQDSTIRTTLKNAFPASVLHFHPVDWNGDNKHSARVELGNTIASKIEVINSDSDAPCFVVGHSHGGTGMQQAMRQNPTASQKVCGWIFLATPFIQAKLVERKSSLPFLIGSAFAVLAYYGTGFFLFGATEFLGLKDGADWLIGIWLSLTYFIVYSTLHEGPKQGWWAWLVKNCGLILAILSTSVVAGWMLDFTKHLDWMPVLKYSLLILAALVCCIYFGLQVSSRKWSDDFSGKAKVDLLSRRLVAELDTSFMAGNNCLFVRSNRDEAAAGLAGVYLLNRLIRMLIDGIHLFVAAFWDQLDFTKLRHPIKTWRKASTLGRVNGVLILSALAPFLVGSVAFFAFILTWVVGISFGADDSWIKPDFLNPLIEFLPGFDLSGQFVELLGKILYGLLLLSVVVALIGGLVLTFASRSFGLWMPFISLFVEMSIEPVPPGKWLVVQRADLALSKDGEVPDMFAIAHSMVYDDEGAIMEVASWMSDRLANQSHHSVD